MPRAEKNYRLSKSDHFKLLFIVKDIQENLLKMKDIFKNQNVLKSSSFYKSRSKLYSRNNKLISELDLDWRRLLKSGDYGKFKTTDSLYYPLTVNCEYLLMRSSLIQLRKYMIDDLINIVHDYLGVGNHIKTNPDFFLKDLVDDPDSDVSDSDSDTEFYRLHYFDPFIHDESDSDPESYINADGGIGRPGLCPYCYLKKKTIFNCIKEHHRYDSPNPCKCKFWYNHNNECKENRRHCRFWEDDYNHPRLGVVTVDDDLWDMVSEQVYARKKGIISKIK